MFMFPDLPEEKRSRLMLALKATFPGEVKHTDSEKEGASFSFPARQFHFWNVYATHVSFYRAFFFILSFTMEYRGVNILMTWSPPCL